MNEVLFHLGFFCSVGPGLSVVEPARCGIDGLRRVLQIHYPCRALPLQLKFKFFFLYCRTW